MNRPATTWAASSSQDGGYEYDRFESSSVLSGQASSRRVSVSCPTCKAPWLIPSEEDEADLLEDDNDTVRQNSPTRPSNIFHPPWIARKVSESSQPRARDPSPFRYDPAGALANFERRHRRRASSIISDSSSQTKVESSSGAVPAPPLRSILSGASSVSSGKATLAGKRSVKFSDAPVYYDCSYRASCVCDGQQEVQHSSYCKLPYECEGECLYDAGYYDYDMFSFEQPDEIPSVKRWGIFSRFVAWLRKKRGKRVCCDEEKQRPSISRPYPLGVPQVGPPLARGPREKKRITKPPAARTRGRVTTRNRTYD